MQPGDTGNYNAKYLMEAATKIVDNEQCIKHFKHYNIAMNIHKFMLCCFGGGIFDGNGNRIISKIGSRSNECAKQFRKLNVTTKA